MSATKSNPQQFTEAAWSCLNASVEFIFGVLVCRFRLDEQKRPLPPEANFGRVIELFAALKRSTAAWMEIKDPVGGRLNQIIAERDEPSVSVFGKTYMSGHTAAAMLALRLETFEMDIRHPDPPMPSEWTVEKRRGAAFAHIYKLTLELVGDTDYAHLCQSIADRITREAAWLTTNMGRAHKGITDNGKKSAAPQWVLEAILAVNDEPGISDVKLAEMVNKHPATVGRKKLIKQARKMAVAARALNRPIGTPVKDKNTGRTDFHPVG